MAKDQAQKSKGLLAQLKDNLENKFGEGFVSIHENAVSTPRIPTGVLSLDAALGGGIGQGRMTELFGKSASGKTTLALFILKQALELFPDKGVAYIDAEHVLEEEWVVKLGLNLPKVLIIKPSTLEEGLITLEEILPTKAVSAIVYDSIPASLPQVSMEGEIGDANIGVHARVLSQNLPRICTKFSKTEEAPAIIFINQKRANFGGRQSFQGEQTKATGGFSFPYYMTSRLEVTRIGALKDSKEKEYGQEVLVYVNKHKMSPGHGARVTFRIDNTIGIDTNQELLDMAIESGEIIKSGSWFVLPNGSKVQGEVKAKEWIQNNINETNKTKETK